MKNLPFSSRLTTAQRTFLIGSPLVIGLLTPSLTLLGVQVIVGGVPFGVAIEDILQKQFAHGHNLFTLALIGMIPFVLLAVMLISYTANHTRRACFAMGLSGHLGILAFMIPAHIDVWYPLYGPGRMSSTGVIAFLFIPFICIVTLFFGLFIGHLITRFRWFRGYSDRQCQKCGYDLTGNESGTCPECGTEIQA